MTAHIRKKENGFRRSLYLCDFSVFAKKPSILCSQLIEIAQKRVYPIVVMTCRHIPAEIIKKRGVSVKKRILSILLAALMLLSALPLGMVDTAYAAALASGKCGDSATWTLDSTGTLTISGTGATYNYDMDDDGNSAAPWCTKARIQRVNKVVVNSGITELGYSMFSNCTQLTSVSLPSGLKRIGSCLFLGCTRLSAITIPSSVTTIESNAFTHCDSITAITLPSGLRTMGDAVCSQMAKLTTATVSGGVTYLSNYAFNDCPGLKTITLPNTVKSIGICAFRYDTALKDVYFNGSVTQWTSIQIAGEGNSALYNADVHCTGLPAPTVTGGNDSQGRPTLKWNAVSGAAKYEVYRSYSENGDYIKYSTVTGTGYTNISYIENGNTYYYKVRALDASGTAGAWSSIVSVTYRAASTGTLPAPTVTGGNDAQGRPTLKWKAVTGAAKYEVYRARSKDGDYIKYSTVTGTSYTNISYIENGNTYYYKVRALKSDGTAGAWSSIVSVTYRKPAAATVASGKCGDSAKWTLDAAGTLTISGSGRMYDYEWPADRGGTTPPWLANKYRDSIRTLRVEQGITYIGRCAFDSCGNLSDVTLPTSLRIIGQCAFNDCTALRSIQLPEGLTTIKEDAFNAAGLVSITFPSTLRELRNGAFMNCEKLQSLRLPEGLTTIGVWAFYCNPNISSIYIPVSVTTIGEEAFIYYNNLDTVRYGGSQSQWNAVSVAANAFPDGVRYVYNVN